MPLLAAMKRLRGTPFDPFGYGAERRMERQLIRQYEADIGEILNNLNGVEIDAAVALAELPLQIRGFGPVKRANHAAAMQRRDEMLAALRAGTGSLEKAAE